MILQYVLLKTHCNIFYLALLGGVRSWIKEGIYSSGRFFLIGVSASSFVQCFDTFC